MNKLEREFEIAELIAESEEQRRFDKFYEKIPNLIIRHKTQESHLPLMFVSSAEVRKKGSYNDFCENAREVGETK